MFRCIVTSRGIRAAWLACCVLGLAGCTHLFFLPSRQQFLSPDDLGLRSADVRLRSDDGTPLFAWHLQADTPRGVICFFHGNAQNISTHILNVAWLPPQGYDVLLLDYRGYGASGGKPSLDGALDDVRAALDWCLAHAARQEVPVYALGQSLGAALMLEAVADAPYRDSLAGVVADSSFAGYRRITRDVLSQSRFLALLKYPLSWLVTSRHDPVEAVARRGGLPLLLLHSPADEVVPFGHGRILQEAASSPTCFVTTSGMHNVSLRAPTAQEAVTAFLVASGNGKAGKPVEDLACP